MLSSDTGDWLSWEGKPTKMSATVVVSVHRKTYYLKSRKLYPRLNKEERNTSHEHIEPESDSTTYSRSRAPTIACIGELSAVSSKNPFDASPGKTGTICADLSSVTVPCHSSTFFLEVHVYSASGLGRLSVICNTSVSISEKSAHGSVKNIYGNTSMKHMGEIL
jgi:hypothetical protein